MRGVLTDEIKRVSKARLGVEISQDELRLMPYVQQVLMNGRQLDASKLNDSELDIIALWREKGFIEGGIDEFGADFFRVSVNKSFWDAMGEILWLSYARPD